MGSIGAFAVATIASVALCCACGCGDSSAKQQVADPSLYEPKIVQAAPTKPAGAAHAPPRTLKPATVSGVAMAPQSLFDGKLQILVPQTFTQMSESEIASLFKGAARPDVVFQSADKEMFLVIAQLKDPMLPDQVKGGFERAKKGMLAAYPDCTKRSETLAEVDGRTWMRFDLDGEKRVMVAVTSLDGRTLRIEASFVSKPAPKLTDAVKKMWETAVVADGHS
jgi:hypothetical protein